MGDSTRIQRFHQRPGDWPEWIDPEAPNPSGKCQCGCEGDAPIAQKTQKANGLYAGQPTRFIKQHHARKHTPRYEVHDTGYETPCWIWVGVVDHAGYGRISIEGERQQAYTHVLFFERANGSVPDGLHVHHLCEQKACCNPDHLEAVTQLVHRRIHMKISMETREEIRRATGSTRQIARRFGVSKSHVALIRSPNSRYS